MKYRPEIDGLRAVAVMPVIFFHAGFASFAGGYVGVDVFFVISGYLITTILINDLEAGQFSLARFYERRARRILPALFFMMVCCLPFAWMWMLPSQFKDFSQALVAVSLFASNILFWRKTDYFAPAAEENPLLHTWSLAVEEQFYIFFPILLWLLWHYGRGRVFWVIVGLCAISLGVAEWGWRNAPAANFYLIVTRAWELGAGAICAFVLQGRVLRPNTGFAALGLGLILFSVFVYDADTPFPSLYALAPVGGTALIILFAAQGTWVARLLSMRGFVGIGLISYSAYLWHQPLFAFARLRSLTEPGHGLMAGLALASLLLAWATWRWVEQPFRQRGKPLLATRARVFAASAAVTVLFAGIGVAGHVGRGFEGRLSAEIRVIADSENDRAGSACNFSRYHPAHSHPQPQCLSPAGGVPEVMLIGDSHMWALADGLRAALQDADVPHYLISHTSCLPLPGFQIYDSTGTYNCRDFLDESFAYARDSGIHTLVLAARFPLYLHGNRYNNTEGGVEGGLPGWVDLAGVSDSRWDSTARESRVLAAYEEQIRALARQFNVVLVYPIPEAGWNVPSIAFKIAFFNGERLPVSTSYAAYQARTEAVTALFDRLVAELPEVFAARVHEALCSAETGRCMNADESHIYYYDDDHPSNTGARLLAPVILSAIEDAG